MQVLAAAASSFVLGALWYGPLSGESWQRLTGLTAERLRSANPARVFGLAFVLAVAQTWVFAMLLGANPSLALGLGAGAAAGLCWVGAAFAIDDLFERRPLALWAVDAGYHTLAFTLSGLVFALFE